MTSITSASGSVSDLRETGRTGPLHVAAALARRWPTWLAIAVAALNLADLDDGLEFATVLLVAAVGYLTITVVDRPRATWGVLVGLLAAVVLIRMLGVDPRPVLIVAAAALVAAGLVRGQLRRPGLYAAQPPAALGFVAIALVALSVAPGLGRYLVAAGLIGHATWDAVHWRADRIVTRSFAEWCGVLDLALGVGVLLA